MTRQVKAKRQSIDRELNPQSTDDKYTDRLIKMIPADVVAAYLACNATIAQFAGPAKLYWIVLCIILALLPVYLVRLMQVTDILQIVIMCLAFLLWCSTNDQPFKQLFESNPTQRQLYSTLALTLFTFGVPLFYKGEKSL